MIPCLRGETEIIYDLLVCPRPTYDRRPTVCDSDPSPKILALVSFATSIAFLAHYYRYSQILLSGDAVAHITIARRVFDSRTPGPSQLGTVWLPLQHILTIPFIVSDSLWSSGIGGSIPSMLGYVLGVLGIYRLVRDNLNSRLAAWVAAVVYGANPNLLYVQTTALNEPLSMALLVWAVVCFADFARDIRPSPVAPSLSRLKLGPQAGEVPSDQRPATESLIYCGLALFANSLIRYDGWFNIGAFILATAIVIAWPTQAGFAWAGFRRHKTTLLKFLLLAVLGPALWLGWNAAIFGNPLEFATGPYSAKAIEERTRRSGDPHHPGWHAPYVAGQYFVRDAMLNLGAGRLLVGPPQQTPFAPTARPGRWEYHWVALALFGTLAVILIARGALPLLLLWVPLPFYAAAIAWGGVPLFIPVWWPFSYYNTRYALELLPAFAVFWAAAAWLVSRSHPTKLWRTAVMVAALVLIAFSYGSIWRTVPVDLREVRANGGARYAMDTQLSTILRRIPGESTILMYLGDHGGALQRAAIPLRRTINEGNYDLWKAALAQPAASGADYIVATDGDPLWEAIGRHPEGLMSVGVVDAPWQRPIRIYRPIK